MEYVGKSGFVYRIRLAQKDIRDYTKRTPPPSSVTWRVEFVRFRPEGEIHFPTMPHAEKRCYLTTIAPDVLDRILSNLCPPVWNGHDPFERAEAVSGLMALMTTCRTLCTAAKTVLYRKPAIPESRREPDWNMFGEVSAKSRPSEELKDAARRLRRYIEGDKTIANAVTDLSHLAHFVSYFETRRGDTSSSDDPEGYEIQNSMLRHCYRLKKVAVCLNSIDHAKQVGSLLRALPDLTSLRIRPGAGCQDETYLDTLRACISQFKPENAQDDEMKPSPVLLDHLELNVRDHPCGTPSCRRLGVALHGVASTLELYFCGPESLAPLPCFLPREVDSERSGTAGLKALCIRLEGADDTARYDCIFGHLVGNHLRTFTLFDEYGNWQGSLGEYDGDRERLNVYDISVFRLFPHAQQLRLSNGEAMDLNKLATLAESSPELKQLDLSNSFWTFEPSDLALAPGSTLSTFEQNLINILNRFEHLQFVDLGIWPYKSRRGAGAEDCGRPGLALYARQRGLKLVVAGCNREEGWFEREMEENMERWMWQDYWEDHSD
ncbi:hypothetical protein JCM10908_005788 [Rhodotorula pacifica]|uniref:uncharacterized protein n=1 Tax=Rhodotorula pacifica TaxID=1495444 RepID=UPI00316BC25B